MSSHSSLDRESFQKLLASAFAVQESGMKPESLAALLELQRSIRMGHRDVEGAAHLIAEWARSVANANGVAIGRLKGDQLIYTAGSGSAASYIGRCVMATFNASAHNDLPSEILRVNDTTADGRIEAAVCRQFGVKSLLILPIYRGRFVAGVLQILFNEAHSFQDQEVRTYWILAGLVGEAMLQAPLIQKRSSNVTPVVIEEVIDHFPAPRRDPLPRVEPVEVAQVPPHVEARPAPEVPRGLLLDRSSLLNPIVLLCKNHSRLHRLRAPNLRPYQIRQFLRHRISALVVASIILISAWILSTAPPATISSVAAPPLVSPNMTMQPPPTGASQSSVGSTASAALPAEEKYPATRYVESDGRSPSSDVGSRVKHFGNDVTVRYFTPRVATVKTAADSEVHRVSDDVTIRYFKPRNAAPPAEPAATGSSQSVSR